MEKTSDLSVDEKILVLAQTASSSHNSQPWELEKRSDGVYTVSCKNDRWLNKVDPEKRELILSLGAYLENLRIAAECYGYRADIEFVMRDADDRSIARFFLVKQSETVNKDRIRLMSSSSMEKVKYKKNIQQMEEFLQLLEKGDNTLWIDRKDPVFDYILEATVEANRVQVWNDEKQMELAEYICFSRDDEDSGIGMTPQMLNLPWFMSRSWYKKADSHSVMSGLFRKGTVGKAKGLMKNCAGVILIAGSDSSVLSLLECGGVFQRLYWECKEMGVELHTLSQALEESPWKDEISDVVGSDKTIQFILRAGETGKSIAGADAVSSASIRMSYDLNQ